MASIKPYQSKGKTLYRVQVYAGIDPITGKKKYRSRQGIQNERAAKAVATKLEYLVQEGKDVAKPKILTFGDVSKDYWASYVGTVRATSAHTVKSIVTNHVSPALDSYRINFITTAVIQKLVNQWAKEAPSLCKRGLNYIQEVYRYGRQMGIVTKDPTEWVKMPLLNKGKKDDQFLYWNKDQLAKFFSFLSVDDGSEELEKFVLFKVLFMGGLRRGEVMALTWSDVDIKDDNEVDVNVNKTWVAGDKINKPKTKASERIIPIIDPALVHGLHKWKKAQNDWLRDNGQRPHSENQQLVFTGVVGNQFLSGSLPGRWLKGIINAHKLEPRISLHKARHSFISNLLLAGVPIPTVQRLAGHSKPDTTLAVYAHISKENKVEAAQKLSQYLFDGGTDSEKDSGKDSNRTKPLT